MAELQVYDINFALPIRELESDKLLLTPFIPSIHAQIYYEGSKAYSELYRYFPFGIPSYEALLVWLEDVREDPGRVLFAMVDKTKISYANPAPLAGMVGLLNTNAENLSTEIGMIITLPPYQRTHVSAHAIGLLLSYCFTDLKLRRVQWRCDPMNIASARSAERMGFRREMIQRWHRVGTAGAGNVPVRENDVMPNNLGLHILHLSMCWDDWNTGGKEQVRALMDRF